MNPVPGLKIAHGAVNPGQWQFWGGYESIGSRHLPEEEKNVFYIVNQFRSYSLYVRFYLN